MKKTIPAIDTSQIFEPVSRQLEQVRCLINDQLRPLSCNSPVLEITSGLKAVSGKMIRPALVLLSGKCCGKITAKHIKVAAVIELLHNATLLHDDVLDNGLVRRGKKTINRLYGNEPAVLLGDLLLSRVFRMTAAMEPKVNDILSSTTARLCEGELRQTIRKNNWQLSESEYLDIITEKSAILFSSSCLLGAMLSGASQKQTRMLSDYGLHFGRAYQIADDLLDIIGSRKQTGKTLGTDVNKRKPTLALIHLLNKLGHREKISLIKKLAAQNGDMKTIRKMLEVNGSLEYARGRIAKLVYKAINSISSFPQAPSKKALVQIAEFLGRVTA